MNSRRNVLTTGEVAKICCVAPRTVSKWFDSGQLRGYRIPGSKNRRIPVEQLIRFMRAHGIPLNGLDNGRTRLLVLDGDTALWDGTRRALEQGDRYEVSTVTAAFEAGAVAQEIRPHVLVVDVTLPDVVPKNLALRARSLTELQGTRLVGVAEGMTDAQGQALLQDGFDGYLSKPFDLRSLTELIDRLSVVSPGTLKPLA